MGSTELWDHARLSEQEGCPLICASRPGQDHKGGATPYGHTLYTFREGVVCRTLPVAVGRGTLFLRATGIMDREP